MNQAAIVVKNLRHFYHSADRRVLVYVPSLTIPMGSWVTFLGPSGSGKSTILNRLGLLMSSNQEHSSIEQLDIYERTPNGCKCHDIPAMLRRGKAGMRELEALRRNLLGFYLQNGELLPTLNLKDNVAMPLRLNGYSEAEANRRAEELLGYLLGVSAHNVPNKFILDNSGGEYQRVAIARALAHRPQILFVDEPTSSLDAPNKRRVLDLMAKLVNEEETTVVMITHDESLAYDYSDYIVNLQANSDGWGELIPVEFRESDGFGQPALFRAKSADGWVATASDFQVK